MNSTTSDHLGSLKIDTCDNQIIFYQAEQKYKNQYLPLSQATLEDSWIEVIQLTKKLCLNHLGELKPRLLVTINGAPFGPQNFESGDPKNLFLDSYFFAHDVFQHGWSTGLGYFNLANIGGEINSGHIERPGSEIPCHLLKTSDIPRDALQQLSHIQRQATHDYNLGNKKKNPSLELWSALDLAKSLGDPSIPEQSVLTIYIGRPRPDRYFVEDLNFSQNDHQHQLLLEYENPFQTFIDYAMLQRAEKQFQELITNNVQPSFSHQQSHGLEIGYCIDSDTLSSTSITLLGFLKSGLPVSMAQFQKVFYQRTNDDFKEELTGREIYLLEKGITESKIEVETNKWVSIYQRAEETGTAYLFFKQQQENTIETISKTRFRFNFSVPVLDVLTHSPYQKSKILEISLSTPKMSESQSIEIQPLLDVTEHFVATFNDSEQKRMSLICGSESTPWGVVGSPITDKREEQYQLAYHELKTSKNSYLLNFLNTIGLTLKAPEDVYFCPLLKTKV
ncbi:MAG: hypothetical protein QNJ42_13110 [Crocosphaera sp.]|nr:hypothetical protein [Crocosphaera sp.]